MKGSNPGNPVNLYNPWFASSLTLLLAEKGTQHDPVEISIIGLNP